MSINWVMLHETDGFVRLPGERLIYTSPPRTSFTLKSHNSVPQDDSISIQSNSGCVHLTNQRIVYLPAQPTPEFESFSAPLLNLHDTHVAAPFFGPNVWTAMVLPILGGRIPATNVTVQLKMTFKDGGAFDFHSAFERIKDRLQEVVDQAVEDGTISRERTERAGANRDLNFNDVHLDQLPAYEGPGTTSDSCPPPFTGGQSFPISRLGEGPSRTPDDPRPEPPRESSMDPPPNYEEAQQLGVASHLEARIRHAS